jgi:hypothetical protein
MFCLKAKVFESGIIGVASGLLRFPYDTSRVVGHHAASIRLGDLDISIALTLESHRSLRTSIIDSIVGEFPAALVV